MRELLLSYLVDHDLVLICNGVPQKVESYAIDETSENLDYNGQLRTLQVTLVAEEE